MPKRGVWPQPAKLILALVAGMVAVFVANSVLPWDLRVYGIAPRQLHSLPCLFSAPFLHANWAHLASNLVGFAIFSGLCATQGSRTYLKVSVTIVILGGLLVWSLGRNYVHIGASGWVFGLWAYCIARAWFQRSFFNIALAVAVLVFYGGMAYGLLPSNPYISFESHLFGALAGVVAAALFARKGKT